MPSMVQAFCEVYDKDIPKKKNKVNSLLKPLDVIEVQGVKSHVVNLKSTVSWDMCTSKK